MQDFMLPGPSRIFLFLDERPDSIDNGLFVLAPIGYPDRPRDWAWANYPANYHRNAANFSFADGHVESHRWVDPRTTLPYVPNNYCWNVWNGKSPNNRDVFWVIDHGTRP
jgi:prepilin-type processing-associated H-X9-DG protein